MKISKALAPTHYQYVPICTIQQQHARALNKVLPFEEIEESSQPARLEIRILLNYYITFSTTFSSESQSASFATKFPNKAPLEETPYFTFYIYNKCISKPHAHIHN